MIDFLFILFNISFGFLIYRIILNTDQSSNLHGKSTSKKLNKIAQAAKHKKQDFLNLTRKGKDFSIKIVDQEVPEGVKYSTIPVYTCKNVFINDELVCRVHRLERLFSNSYCVEFSYRRNEFEIDNLIKDAAKTAKHINKLYWKTQLETNDTKNSFY
jgi:hypothetical protein